MNIKYLLVINLIISLSASVGFYKINTKANTQINPLNNTLNNFYNDNNLDWDLSRFGSFDENESQLGFEDTQNTYLQSEVDTSFDNYVEEPISDTFSFNDLALGEFSLPQEDDESYSNYSSFENTQNIELQDQSNLNNYDVDNNLNFDSNEVSLSETDSDYSDYSDFQPKLNTNLNGNFNSKAQQFQSSSNSCISNATPNQVRLIKEAVRKASQLNYVIGTCLQSNPKIQISVVNRSKVNAFVSKNQPNVININTGMLNAIEFGRVMKIRTANGVETALVKDMLPCVLIHEKSHTDQRASISGKESYNYFDVGVTFSSKSKANKQMENDAIQREQDCSRHFGLPVRVAYSVNYGRSQKTNENPSIKSSFSDENNSEYSSDDSNIDNNIDNVNTQEGFGDEEDFLEID